jgi:hypothetical protein
MSRRQAVLSRLSFALFVAAMLCSASFGCADEFVPPEGGTVTLSANDGVDFHTGLVKDPGNYLNSDLFASENGDSGLKLSTGGDAPTSGRPIIWFRTPGQTLETYESLEEVPLVTPEREDPLLHAKPGLGFVLETEEGDLVRGWLSAADAGSVTIEWVRE